MKNQRGITLIFALILLTVITIVVVYNLEGTSLQSRMIVNSMIKNQVYQECRNEIEANMIFYNRQGARDELLEHIGNTAGFNGTVFSGDHSAAHPPKSNLQVTWRYVKQDNASSGASGSTIDTTATSVSHLYEIDCNSTLRFAEESQTQGTSVNGLKDSSIVN